MKSKDIALAIIFIITLINFVIGITLIYGLSGNCNVYQKEDVNRDGVVDIKDLLIVQKNILSQKELEDR